MPNHIRKELAAAVAAKHTRYFTGLPCRNGHTAERWTNNSGCVECGSDYERTINRRILQHRRRGLPEPTRPCPDKCECCGQPPGRKALNLDHDHNTGLFRGWLCSACNRGIGYLGDSAEGLQRAISYLNRRLFT